MHKKKVYEKSLQNNSRNISNNTHKNVSGKRINNNKSNSSKKNAKKQVEFILKLFLVISAIILFIMSPIFNVSKINVHGNNYYSSEEIVKNSEIVTGINGFKNIGGNYKHYFLLRYGQAEKNILLKCPYVKEAIVKFSIPDKLIISITERTPIMIIPYLSIYLLVDREGYVVETIGDTEGYNLPQIKGIKFPGYGIGQALELENKENFNELIFLIDTLTEEDKSDNFKIVEIIDNIDISNSNNIHFFIDSRLIVNIGNLDNLSYKIKSLKQIFYKNIGTGEKGFLDFTSGDYPVFIPN